MTRRIKYTASIKIRVCEEYLSGTIGMKELCQKYNIPYSEKAQTSKVYKWGAAYREKRMEAFIHNAKNNSYSCEFKVVAVEDYFLVKSSLWDICIKYSIPSESTLRKWISLYNANREIKDYCPKQEVYFQKTNVLRNINLTCLLDRGHIINHFMSLPFYF